MSQSNISPVSQSSYESKNLEDVLSIKKQIKYDSECIRKKSNWTKSDNQYKLDSDTFNPKLLLKDIKSRSPKLDALLKKIKDLDRADMKRDGTLYKHFIFCDVKSSANGARMIASAFVANDYTLGYEAKRKGEKSPDKSSEKKQEKTRKDTPRPLDIAEINIPKSFPEMEKIIENEDSDSDEEIEKTKISAKLDLEEQKGGDGSTKVKRYQKLELLSKNALKKTENENFYLLSSVDVFDQPISVMTKKEMLSNFNARPKNVHGEEIRFIIMDSGFKEGIDLFDIKYVHIFEPPVNGADLKQVIGRGTRTCGQQGLSFHPTRGWPLHVFIYDISIPQSIRSQFLNSTTAFDFYLNSLNMDMKLVNFAKQLEEVSIFGAVDYDLNKNVHEFSVQKGGGPKKRPPNNLVVEGAPIIADPTVQDLVSLPSGQQVSGFQSKPMGHSEMRKFINAYFKDTKWDKVKMENMCDESAVAKKKGGSKVITYTPTQRFVQKYFTPQAPVNGMLLWHSTGTGKTCSAIAAATSSFASQGYTILWVTRTTLKNDIWKNMFDLICNEEIRKMVADGVTIPREHDKRMKLLSDAWKIRPISYKQFSNLVSKGNSYYQRLVDINGESDPLRKTLLIIDEAHKLYGGGDLSSVERPDMKALHKSLMDSYAISGRNSVRLLLMTATPITENPMELVKLVNLCKTTTHQMEDQFPLFSEKYLNKEGAFTESGENKYLNAIAGHISYLNREKDARQFAQPQIEHIDVPMMEDEKEVKDMDKRLIREIMNKETQELKREIDAQNDKIDDDFRDLESSRFYTLRDICDEYDGKVKRGCLKIANNNIRELIKEAKSYTKEIKDKIKTIKEELKKKNLYKKKVMDDIKSKFEKNPQSLLDFQNSVYYVLKYSCAKMVKESANASKIASEHPDLVKMKAHLDVFDNKMEILDNDLKILVEKQKIRLIELREMMKDEDLNKLEKFVIKSTIKKEKEMHKQSRKRIKGEIRDQKKGVRKSRNRLSKKIDKLKTEIQKDLLESAKQQKIDKKDKKTLKKQMSKTLRKQGNIREEFREGILKDIVSKYKKKVEEEFSKEKVILEKEEKEHQEKKEKKEKEQQEKKEKKEKEQQEKKEKREKKEKEKTRKKHEKEEKKREKDAEKEKKKKEKELKKTMKKR